MKYLKSNNLIGESKEAISNSEFWELYHSIHTEVDYSLEEYWSIKYKILGKKSNSFRRKIHEVESEINLELDNKIKIINSQNTRIACFSGFEGYKDIYDKLEMWAHYADNHRGICVEYDISKLKENLVLKWKPWEYLKKRRKHRRASNSHY
ncbi:MAG: DUF2971 domain-containing protein [Eubacteriaceae bacterium]